MGTMARSVFRNGLGRKGPAKPWLPWYPQHWLSDVDLQGLGLAAQGLYMNFLMATWSCHPRGAMDGRAFDAFSRQSVARMGRMRRRFDALWRHIVAAKLVSPLKGGGWYSRRIVREHGDLGAPQVGGKAPKGSGVREHQRTEEEQKESRKDQTVRVEDSHTPGGLFSTRALTQMVESVGGKQFRSPVWRGRLLKIYAKDGAAGELIYALEKVQSSLAGRGELRIDDPGAYVGEVIMRLAGERRK